MPKSVTLTLRDSNGRLLEARRFEIGEAPILLGRGDHCGWRVQAKADSGVSREHCKLEWIGDRLNVTDLSANGTFLNRTASRLTRKQRYLVTVGDKLSFAGYELLVDEDVTQVEARDRSRNFRPRKGDANELPTSDRSAVAESVLNPSGGPGAFQAAHKWPDGRVPDHVLARVDVARSTKIPPANKVSSNIASVEAVQPRSLPSDDLDALAEVFLKGAQSDASRDRETPDRRVSMSEGPMIGFGRVDDFFASLALSTIGPTEGERGRALASIAAVLKEYVLGTEALISVLADAQQVLFGAPRRPRAQGRRGDPLSSVLGSLVSLESPDAAARETRVKLEVLKREQLELLSNVRAGIEELLAELSPINIEKQLPKQGGLSPIIGLKGKLWDAYTLAYERLAETIRDDPKRVFRKVVRDGRDGKSPDGPDETDASLARRGGASRAARALSPQRLKGREETNE